MTNKTGSLDDVFHALADPTRRAVLQRLSQGPASVSELAQPFGMALPSFVQHLKVLETSGLIRSWKAGRVRTCELEAAQLGKAESWITEQRTYWERRFDRLDAYVKQLQDKENNHGENG
jgi:DNA-binding transcriptional ArsR family regulator